MMSRYFTVWMSFVMLAPLLLAAGAIVCSERDKLLQLLPSKVTQQTDCLMECTGMTYLKKVELQDNRNIRLKDSSEGDLGEYCWSMEIKCTVGESFQHAYVVVPVDTATVGQEMLEVKTTGATASTLPAHNSPTAIAENCGILYDVTQHFTAENVGTSFCVQVITQGGVLGNQVLKCPPYMVTFWQRIQNQSNQEGAG